MRFKRLTEYHLVLQNNNQAPLALREGDWVFRITADRFLHGMVRTIVGSLMDVGFGKIIEEEFRHILGSKDRRRAGQAAPARGLVLQEVAYPDHV